MIVLKRVLNDLVAKVGLSPANGDQWSENIFYQLRSFITTRSQIAPGWSVLAISVV